MNDILLGVVKSGLLIEIHESNQIKSANISDRLTTNMLNSRCGVVGSMRLLGR